MFSRVDVTTRQATELLDITATVRQTVHAAGVASGLVLVSVPHTTAAVTVNENADPDVVGDLLRRFATLAPPCASDLHAEGNSAAHLLSSLVGNSVLLPVVGGKPHLGTWQGIYFCEFDGPRQRQVDIQVLCG